MKTGFKDSTEVPEGPKKKSPWNFDAPHYDERSSCAVNAGSCYGVGHKTPVGTDRVQTRSVIPTGRPKTLETTYRRKDEGILDVSAKE